MYGYTPPTIVAVDPDLLVSCAGFQHVADAIAAELRNRPTWVVVGAPQSLKEADSVLRPLLVESFCMDPRDAPDMTASHADVIATVLESHMRHIGCQVPVLLAPDAPQHVEASRIIAGNWKDAARIAKTVGTAQVLAWTADPDWVVERVGGVPFVPVLNHWGLA